MEDINEEVVRSTIEKLEISNNGKPFSDGHIALFTKITKSVISELGSSDSITDDSSKLSEEIESLKTQNSELLSEINNLEKELDSAKSSDNTQQIDGKEYFKSLDENTIKALLSSTHPEISNKLEQKIEDSPEYIGLNESYEKLSKLYKEDVERLNQEITRLTEISNAQLSVTESPEYIDLSNKYNQLLSSSSTNTENNNGMDKVQAFPSKLGTGSFIELSLSGVNGPIKGFFTYEDMHNAFITPFKKDDIKIYSGDVLNLNIIDLVSPSND